MKKKMFKKISFINKVTSLEAFECILIIKILATSMNEEFHEKYCFKNVYYFNNSKGNITNT